MKVSLRQIVSLLLLGTVLTLSGCSWLPKVGWVPKEGQVPQEIPKKPAPPPSDLGSYTKVGRPYAIFGVTYYPIPSAQGYVEEGIASWYGPRFHGGLTANGEIFDMYGISAAHKTLPLPVQARITNLNNGLWSIVRINDRGPFIDGRVVDLSFAAAEELGFDKKGTARVRIEALGPAEKVNATEQARLAQALASPPKYLKPQTKKAVWTQASVQPGDHKTEGAQHGYFVQVGAFNSKDNADNMIKRLNPEGPTRIQPGSVGGKLFFRVLLGPFTSPYGANVMVARLSQVGITKTHIIMN